MKNLYIGKMEKFLWIETSYSEMRLTDCVNTGISDELKTN